MLLLVPVRHELLTPCLVIVGIGYGGLLPSMAIMRCTTSVARISARSWASTISYDVAAAGAPLFTAYLYDLYGTYTVPDEWNTLLAWIGVSLVFVGLKSALEPAPQVRPALAACHFSPD